MNPNLKESYGFMFSEPLLNEIERNGEIIQFKAGDEIIDYGQKLSFFPLLLNGAVRIMREDKEGNELLLYFLEKGDTCAFSLNCCMSQKMSEIRAEAESDTEIIMIPIQKLNEWICRFDEWKSFVLQSYHARVNELLDIVDAMAFQQLDNRLLNYLKEKVMVTKDTHITATHQEIARDLNSSRVVITRLLKKLENQKIIKTSRNKIELLDF